MPKRETRRRYQDPLGYQPAREEARVRARLDGGDPTDPPSDEVEVVETHAIQGGKVVKIRVYADQVDAYEEVIGAALDAGLISPKDLA